jgi:anti-sigma factor RsiW
MNPTHDEENLIRWLDGEMDEAEQTRFEARLQADPVLHAEAQKMQRLGSLLKDHLPPAGDIPNPDFFNAQIQRSIMELQQAQHPVPKPEIEHRGLLGWLRMPWMVAGAAAVIAALVLVNPERPASGTEIVRTYAPNPAVQVRVLASTEANATVLMLDGLPELPAATPLVGFKVHRTETDPRAALTTLFSEENEVLLVLAQSAQNPPQLYAR